MDRNVEGKPALQGNAIWRREDQVKESDVRILLISQGDLRDNRSNRKTSKHPSFVFGDLQPVFSWLTWFQSKFLALQVYLYSGCCWTVLSRLTVKSTQALSSWHEELRKVRMKKMAWWCCWKISWSFPLSFSSRPVVRSSLISWQQEDCSIRIPCVVLPWDQIPISFLRCVCVFTSFSVHVFLFPSSFYNVVFSFFFLFFLTPRLSWMSRYFFVTPALQVSCSRNSITLFLPFSWCNYNCFQSLQ